MQPIEPGLAGDDALTIESGADRRRIERAVRARLQGEAACHRGAERRGERG